MSQPQVVPPSTVGVSTMSAERGRVRALRALRVLDQPEDDRYDRITRIAAELFEVPMVSLTLIDAHRQWRASWVGPLRQEECLDGALCALAMRSTQTFVRTDLRADPDLADNPFVTAGLQFYAGEPLRAPDGEPIGTLCVMDDRPHEITPGQLAALGDLGRWAERELWRATEEQQVAQVQRRLLPHRPPELPGYAFVGLHAPASGTVGSDFYDWHLVDGGAQFVVADVLGHGLGAALVAATVRASFRSTALTADPADHLNATGRLLRDDLTGLGVDVAMFLGRIDGASGRLTYVDAGTWFTLVVHPDGSHDRLPTDGPPLGDADPRCRPRTVTLAPGDTLVCASVNLQDRGLRPTEVVRRVAAFLSTAEPAAIDACVTRVELDHQGSDDLTAVVVRRLAVEGSGD